MREDKEDRQSSSSRRHAESSNRGSSKRREDDRHRDPDQRHDRDDEKHSHHRTSRHRDEERHHRKDDRHERHRSSQHHHEERDDISHGSHGRRDEDKDGRHREKSRHHTSSSSSHISRRHHRDDEERVEHRKDRHRSHRSKTDAVRSSDRQPPEDFIPTSESLSLTSSTADAALTASLPDEPDSTKQLKRDDWMMGVPSHSSRNVRSSDSAAADDISYFASLGKERVKAAKPEKPDPESLKISSRELNQQLVQGKKLDEYEAQSQPKSEFGAPGYQWRMMKLKRVYEAASEEGRDVLEVALERYANREEFERANAEKAFLDNRDKHKGTKRGHESARNSTPSWQSVARRSYLLASAGSELGSTSSPGPSRPGSRQGFKRPGESSNPATPTPVLNRPPRNVGFETPSSKATTPTAIPSVFTPVFEKSMPPMNEGSAEPAQGVVLDDGHGDPDRPILAPDELNKLQAKIMKAELMGDPALEDLRNEYDRESARAQAHSTAGDKGGAFAVTKPASGKGRISSGGVLVGDGSRELQVLPTLDARGRMYDIGSSSSSPAQDATSVLGSNRGKKRDRFEARDPKTGQIVRYSEDDDTVTLGELVRQEKFGSGPRPQKDLDAELAANIMTDAGFSEDLEAQDEEAHRYARKKMKSDAMKRQFAINDFAKTKRVLDTCRFCWQDEGAKPPRATVISSGFRAYLAIPETEPIVEGHTLIVPMQHHLSSLEAEEECWDEIKNFMKCLIRLFASLDKRVIFFETLTSLKHQAHTYIEAVPIPNRAFDTLPGVFKESLGTVGGEFSTNKKVISFTPSRSFRSSLVPNLPYFAVFWDPNASTGYGHVIENMDKDYRSREEENAFDVDEMGAGGGGKAGNFDRYFARQVIGSVLDADQETDDIDIRFFRKPRKSSEDDKRKAREQFRKRWNDVDWTKMLSQQS